MKTTNKTPDEILDDLEDFFGFEDDGRDFIGVTILAILIAIAAAAFFLQWWLL